MTVCTMKITEGTEETESFPIWQSARATYIGDSDCGGIGGNGIIVGVGEFVGGFFIKPRGHLATCSVVFECAIERGALGAKSITASQTVAEQEEECRVQ